MIINLGLHPTSIALRDGLLAWRCPYRGASVQRARSRGLRRLPTCPMWRSASLPVLGSTTCWQSTRRWRASARITVADGWLRAQLRYPMASRRPLQIGSAQAPPVSLEDTKDQPLLEPPLAMPLWQEVVVLDYFP